MNIYLYKSRKISTYNFGITFMQQLFNIAVQKNMNFILLLEHQSIYTTGINDNTSYNHIKVVKTDRGGKITYHGPGQRIIYFILNLHQLYNTTTPDLRKFLNDIYKSLIDVLTNFNIISYHNNGIWVGNDKIASIGLKIKKWITYHGVGLNVNTDLEYFDEINPCGLITKMTSIKKILNQQIDFELIDNSLILILEEIFKCKIIVNYI